MSLTPNAQSGPTASFSSSNSRPAIVPPTSAPVVEVPAPLAARPVPGRASSSASAQALLAPTNIYANPAVVSGAGVVVLLYGMVLFVVLSQIRAKERQDADALALRVKLEAQKQHLAVPPPIASVPTVEASSNQPGQANPKSGSEPKKPTNSDPKSTPSSPAPASNPSVSTMPDAKPDKPKPDKPSPGSESAKTVVMATKPTEPKPAPVPQVVPGLPGLGPWIDPDHDCKIQTEGNRSVVDIPGTKHGIIPALDLKNAPRSLTEVAGEFTATVRVGGKLFPGTQPLADLPIAFQGAGILIQINDKDYIRLERTAFNSNNIPLSHEVMIEVYREGKAAATDSVPASKGPLFLSVERTKGELITKYSPDGKTWIKVKRSAITLPEKLMIGISASNLSPNRLAVHFEDFSLVRGSAKAVPGR